MRAKRPYIVLSFRATVDAIRTLRAQDESAAKLLQGLSFSEDTPRVYIKGRSGVADAAGGLAVLAGAL